MGRFLKNRARLRKPDQLLLQVCQGAVLRIAPNVAKLPEVAKITETGQNDVPAFHIEDEHHRNRW